MISDSVTYPKIMYWFKKDHILQMWISTYPVVCWIMSEIKKCVWLARLNIQKLNAHTHTYMNMYGTIECLFPYQCIIIKLVNSMVVDMIYRYWSDLCICDLFPCVHICQNDFYSKFPTNPTNIIKFNFCIILFNVFQMFEQGILVTLTYLGLRKCYLRWICMQSEEFLSQ